MQAYIRFVLVTGLICTFVGSMWWSLENQGTGFSTVSFPDSTGKANQIESLLRDEFGDQVTHWTEEAVVTYPDGEQVEIYHYFIHPTDEELNDLITELITEQVE